MGINFNEVLSGLYIGNVRSRNYDSSPENCKTCISVGVYDMGKPRWASNYYFYKLLDRQDVSYEVMHTIVFSAAEVIDKCVSRGVLVHCGVGVSRSALVVIGYLMIKKNMSFPDAYALLRSRRSCINPNDGFVEFLKILDAQLTNERRTFLTSQLAKADVNYEDLDIRDSTNAV
ncbi:Dual-specificity protein phosphatase [Giardia duodenalis]|uniref:Dual-specificity protein phosphatase n=1 Tax=Giardia intestinalis (strain ATCC 50803 / WB clone C6) TaxID=184922 RepID=A8B5J1_GIAIC|nr:Dual-specificity protein phosphatase [Giardia intestinalis]KAE8305165.1 Dual-specificity protein phosphatase [Giardia intestinalis]|eukprot:XP_001709234.1 Dual-specificity protein phosphatase [Giardia lamblia ATCC 50803]